MGDFNEFVMMMDRRMSINSQRAEIEQTFKVFDKNGDGKITFDELKEVLTQLGEEVTDKDVMDMIKEADLNGDGAIDFEEFIIIININCLIIIIYCLIIITNIHFKLTYIDIYC